MIDMKKIIKAKRQCESVHEDWCIGDEKGPCNCKGKGRPSNLDMIVANLQHARIKEELRRRSKRREK